MNATMARNIELNVDRCASAIFGVAVAYASFEGLRAVPQSACLGISLLAAIGSYLLCRHLLGKVSEREPDFRVPMFEATGSTPPDELVLTDDDKVCDELLLTDADRVPQNSQEPLILDDVLEAIGPDARVVGMFDRRAMPTPGDLQTRIDARLQVPSPVQPQGDASQELSEALAELRKALR